MTLYVGTVDKLYSLSACTREEAIGRAIEEAKQSAIRLGAAPSTIEVVQQEDSRPAYDTGVTLRIIVKVVGDLDLSDGVRGVADQTLESLLALSQATDQAQSAIQNAPLRATRHESGETKQYVQSTRNHLTVLSLVLTCRCQLRWRHTRVHDR